MDGMASFCLGFYVKPVLFCAGIKNRNKLKRYLNKWKKAIEKNRLILTGIIRKQNPAMMPPGLSYCLNTKVEIRYVL